MIKCNLFAIKPCFLGGLFFKSTTYIDISNVIAKVFLAHYSSKYGCRKARFSLVTDLMAVVYARGFYVIFTAIINHQIRG